MAKRSWAEFECSVFASMAGMDDEKKRLFDLGYNHGKTFLKAMKDGKIDTYGYDIKDFNTALYTIYSYSPSDNIDFMMGQVWEMAEHSDENDFPQILSYDKRVLDQWHTIASKKYENRNCKLL